MIPKISVASAARDLGLPAYQAMLAELGECPPAPLLSAPASPSPTPVLAPEPEVEVETVVTHVVPEVESSQGENQESKEKTVP